MKQRPFREHHLISLLITYDKQMLPLDLVVNQYFRTHTALGAKDRKMIAEAVYGIVRWRGLIDALCEGEATWEKRADWYLGNDPLTFLDHNELPLHTRCSCPLELFQLLVETYGEKRACELCLIANTPAPTTIRVNTLKISRDDLLKQWVDSYPVEACQMAVNGITFRERINLFGLPEFVQGFFEMQDEASQLVAGLVDAQPGQQVLDFCAGSGGKSLAFAPKLEGKGQIFLHDVRPRILEEARKRLRRAGIQNAQVIDRDAPHLKKLKKHMDWVLVDAPCTGSGTLRRNPDMKWKFDQALLKRLLSEQRVIFEQALSYCKPQGHIVYATCSLLRQENQEQIIHFCKVYQLEQVGEEFQSIPAEGGMDGFFAVILRKCTYE